MQVFSLAAECAYTGSHDVALEDCLDLWALATSLQVWPATASQMKLTLSWKAKLQSSKKYADDNSFLKGDVRADAGHPEALRAFGACNPGGGGQY